MSSILWCFGYAALSASLWLVAAFLLQLGTAGRMLAAVGVPAIVAMLDACGYFFVENADWSSMWASTFFVCALFSGGFAGMLALPIWFALEERLGWRVR